MQKYHFKTEGEEPDVECTELCSYIAEEYPGVRIGSAACQSCENCYGWDQEENWVKCLQISKNKNYETTI